MKRCRTTTVSVLETCWDKFLSDLKNRERSLSWRVAESDSSTLLWLSAEQGLNPTALFLDYGQPAAEAEGEAVERICSGLGADWRHVRYAGSNFGPGEIRGRNAFLLHTALLEFPSSSGVVALGIHAGTGYADCSPEFIETMQLSYQLHTKGTITPAAPFSALD